MKLVLQSLFNISLKVISWHIWLMKQRSTYLKMLSRNVYQCHNLHFSTALHIRKHAEPLSEGGKMQYLNCFKNLVQLDKRSIDGFSLNALTGLV